MCIGYVRVMMRMIDHDVFWFVCVDDVSVFDHGVSVVSRISLDCLGARPSPRLQTAPSCFPQYPTLSRWHLLRELNGSNAGFLGEGLPWRLAFKGLLRSARVNTQRHTPLRYLETTSHQHLILPLRHPNFLPVTPQILKPTTHQTSSVQQPWVTSSSPTSAP